MKYTFEFAKVSDKVILDTVKKCAIDNIAINSLRVTTYAGKSYSINGFNYNDFAPQIINILELDGELITGFNFSSPELFNISITRIPNKLHDTFLISEQSGFSDSNPNLTTFIDLIRKELKAIDQAESYKMFLDEESKLFFEAKANELNRLQEFVNTLIKTQSDFYNEQVKQLENKKTQLEEITFKKLEEYEEIYQEKYKELEEKEKLFEEKRAKFDDRDNTVVRREIRDKLHESFKERSKEFKLTQGTRKLRWPVIIFAGSILVFSVLVFIYYSYFTIQLFESDSSFNLYAFISYSIKQFISAIAFGSTAIFLIRWNNKWFEQHANEEFKLKRYEIDIDRASWLVEMALEWKKEKGTEIPEYLLEKLAGNLFDSGNMKDVPLHPADQITSAILGAASSASLKTPVGEFNFDKKGISNLKKNGEQ